MESNVNINVISTQINCHKYTQIRDCNTINLTCGNKTADTMQAQVDSGVLGRFYLQAPSNNRFTGRTRNDVIRNYRFE